MRKTKVVGFSIPPELHKQFEAVLAKQYKTKSEFFRELLSAYLVNDQSGSASQSVNVAEALKAFWDLRASSEHTTLVVGLGIVEHEGKVLIGGRTKPDPHVKKLSWVFPGGKMESLDFASELAREVKEETGLAVSVGRLVAARIHPDCHVDNVQVVALYFACAVEGSAAAKPGATFTDLKWVAPTDVYKHFTTSVSDDVARHLVMLERGAA